ncbi:hypothetical protein GC089_15615 [Cellulomonas sp. JZ18]|uniref:hypothetical protein n=1 Tax=Cellulomonas sp. JZ18 TaxID=2654191 RepID=UPI0012D3A09D|nr:hypothetical protein [Cellulomonas sp. JZ18]QGQ20356.1 hypothetical protein GC089_15615 [Cellulomonas sp. JZ18]
MSLDHGRDALDDLLDASAPAVAPVSARLRDELATMVQEARHDARPSAVVRRLPRAVAVTGAVALLAGGAGAAAATSDLWSPWARTPAATYTYTLPSGAVCEERIGNFVAQDAAATRAAQEWLASVDVLAVADVEGVYARMKADLDVVALDAQGREVPGHYGTPHWNADRHYSMAVHRAVGEAIDAELVRQGFDLEQVQMERSGQISCPGAQW